MSAAGCTIGPSPPHSHSGMSNEWVVSNPEKEGVDPIAMSNLWERIEKQEYSNIHSFLVSRNGKLICERYFSGADGRNGFVEFDANAIHDLRSVSKSITSALVGIAIDQGHIESIEVPIFEFFPKYTKHITDEKKDITVRHLLTMTAGFEWDQSGSHEGEADSQNSEAQLENSDDFVEYVLSRPMSDPPGGRFNYNSGCTILLAGIIKQATGMHVDEFADRYLFHPLDIYSRYWWKDSTGLPQTHAGLRLRPRDMAKIGQLYLDHGKWRGKQILSASWIDESALSHLESGQYGFGWWITEFSISGETISSYFGAGNGGQYIFVLPELNMVIVSTGGSYGGLTPVEEIIEKEVLPAVSPRHRK